MLTSAVFCTQAATNGPSLGAISPRPSRISAGSMRAAAASSALIQPLLQEAQTSRTVALNGRWMPMSLGLRLRGPARCRDGSCGRPKRPSQSPKTCSPVSLSVEPQKTHTCFIFSSTESRGASIGYWKLYFCSRFWNASGPPSRISQTCCRIPLRYRIAGSFFTSNSKASSMASETYSKRNFLFSRPTS